MLLVLYWSVTNQLSSPFRHRIMAQVEVTLGSASGNDRASGSLSQGPPSGLSEINEKATQPHLKKFPDRVISGKTRSFSSRCYDEFKWIEYNRSRDAIFCKACRHFPGSQTEYSFVRNGFQDWKHLRQACLRHASGKTHTVALGKLDAYRESHMSNSRGTVLNQLHGDAFVQRNKEHLKVVLDIVMLCAKQDIALRGHRESSDALNKGNFLEMFKLLSRYDPAIEARLKELPRNSTLMSPDVQNELLGCAVTVLLQKIRQELHVPNTYYAILADEYKDVSKQELVAVCVRYFHAGVIKERAIGFMNTSDLTAAGISEKILQLLEPLELDPLLCVGMCFDGAAVDVREPRRCPCNLKTNISQRHLCSLLLSQTKSGFVHGGLSIWTHKHIFWNFKLFAYIH